MAASAERATRHASDTPRAAPRRSGALPRCAAALASRVESRCSIEGGRSTQRFYDSGHTSAAQRAQRRSRLRGRRGMRVARSSADASVFVVSTSCTQPLRQRSLVLKHDPFPPPYSRCGISASTTYCAERRGAPRDQACRTHKRHRRGFAAMRAVFDNGFNNIGVGRYDAEHDSHPFRNQIV